jgi:hypothetical protein
VTWVNPLLVAFAVLSLSGMGGAFLLLGIQCQRTASEATRANRAERRARERDAEIVGLRASVSRLHRLLDHEASQHAERLADLVAVVGTDT